MAATCRPRNCARTKASDTSSKSAERETKTESTSKAPPPKWLSASCRDPMKVGDTEEPTLLPQLPGSNSTGRRRSPQRTSTMLSMGSQPPNDCQASLPSPASCNFMIWPASTQLLGVPTFSPSAQSIQWGCSHSTSTAPPSHRSTVAGSQRTDQPTFGHRHLSIGGSTGRYRRPASSLRLWPCGLWPEHKRKSAITCSSVAKVARALSREECAAAAIATAGRNTEAQSANDPAGPANSGAGGPPRAHPSL
mmetsp:Transcript_122832/g.358497  ORF Transcript_122832/g.358497 Transcript_122832/m.358497 type:complete len:250 (+) Transcript_122832:996-1745(+)